MTRQYSFQAEPKAAEYIDSIVNALMVLFNISESEAVGRVNQRLRGFTFEDDKTIIFHQGIEDWAYDIYFGHGSLWWLGKEHLKPVHFEPSNELQTDDQDPI